MNKHPLVSIVTPMYNQSAFVGQAIESVLSQSYPHIEYIAIDDGSTDGTPDILAQYNDPRLRVIRQTNIGQTATINKGWAHSRGEIIAWLNSDDLLAPYAVEQAVAALENKNMEALGVFGNCENIDEKGNVIGNFPVRPCRLEDLLFGYGWLPIAQPSTFLRRQVLEIIGYLDQEVFYCMDFDYWLRIFTVGNMFHIGGSPWSFNRFHPEAKSVSPKAKRRAAYDYLYVYHKYFARPDLPESIAKRRGEGLSVAYWHAATRLKTAGDRGLAMKYLVFSLANCPNVGTLGKFKLLVRWLFNRT